MTLLLIVPSDLNNDICDPYLFVFFHFSFFLSFQTFFFFFREFFKGEISARIETYGGKK